MCSAYFAWSTAQGNALICAQTRCIRPTVKRDSYTKTSIYLLYWLTFISIHRHRKRVYSRMSRWNQSDEICLCAILFLQPLNPEIMLSCSRRGLISHPCGQATQKSYHHVLISPRGRNTRDTFLALKTCSMRPTSTLWNPKAEISGRRRKT